LGRQRPKACGRQDHVELGRATWGRRERRVSLVRNHSRRSHTVKAENAPDVIVAAHDWTGDLAANGLVLSLFPTKALKKQFPKYALDAFSYNGRLYGAPYALENVGLVVNTRLVKVPKTFAQFEKEALAFKRKSPDNIALAVPQGSAGDAYHMYPSSRASAATSSRMRRTVRCSRTSSVSPPRPSSRTRVSSTSGTARA